MTCNFFSPQPHMYGHGHMPYFPNCMPMQTHCMPMMPHYMPNPYPHHGCGGVTLNMCTPCCKPEEPKKPPLDLSKLAVTVDAVTGELKDPKTGEGLGQKMSDCKDTVTNLKEPLQIQSGKLVGGCDNNPKCKACMEAINKSIADVRPADGGTPKEPSQLGYHADDAHDTYSAFNIAV